LFGGDDGSIDATVIGGTTPYDYLWSNGSTDEDLYGLTAGTYTIEVYDENGCYATASIILTEPLELDLPTAFSPNGDNYNDLYVIHGIEAYPDNIFQVFNRWGNLVFEAKEYNNTWNGKSNVGGILPDGVYFVILKINDGEIEENTYVHLKTH
jgi:gliding motility-associated-like protein